MGGSSDVLTADTREEAIEKAKQWYESAIKLGLWPRTYIYGKGDVEIVYHDCKSESCFCGGQPLKANIIVVDITEKPKDAETKYPFDYFSRMCLNAEQRKKRFHAFVSAHT